MKRAKIIFNQTLMISTGILFGLGIQALINYLAGGKAEITWPWYIPLSVILTGFLCALATALLIDREGEGRAFGKLAIVLHFLALFAVVAGFGWLFGWYEDIGGLLVISAMYILIYGFVWAATLWITRRDEKAINDAIREIRDEE